MATMRKATETDRPDSGRWSLTERAGDGGRRDSVQLVHPIESPMDPRWVLAIRVAEQLNGAILTLEKRDKLIRLGKVVGISVFDTNMIIAIIQDRARQGHSQQACPAAAQQQLAMIGPPPSNVRRGGRVLSVAWTVVLLITIEIVAIALLVM